MKLINGICVLSLLAACGVGGPDAHARNKNSLRGGDNAEPCANSPSSDGTTQGECVAFEENIDGGDDGNSQFNEPGSTGDANEAPAPEFPVEKEPSSCGNVESPDGHVTQIGCDDSAEEVPGDGQSGTDEPVADDGQPGTGENSGTVHCVKVVDEVTRAVTLVCTPGAEGESSEGSPGEENEEEKPFSCADVTEAQQCRFLWIVGCSPVFDGAGSFQKCVDPLPL